MSEASAVVARVGLPTDTITTTTSTITPTYVRLTGNMSMLAGMELTDISMGGCKDVIVDLVGYRRHGHNEQDAPEITQPLMYHAIRAKPTLLESYSAELEKRGVTESARAHSKKIVTV